MELKKLNLPTLRAACVEALMGPLDSLLATCPGLVGASWRRLRAFEGIVWASAGLWDIPGALLVLLGSLLGAYVGT
eukprot:1447502-Pyramimonas_sp.AAC.1